MLFLFYPIPVDNLSNILAIFSGSNSIDLGNRFCHPVAIEGAFRDVQCRPVWTGEQYSECGTGVQGNDEQDQPAHEESQKA